MYKYIEIVENSTKEVVKRLDVTGYGERSLEKIERGMNINFNHSGYSTQVTDSKTQLELIRKRNCLIQNLKREIK